MSAQITEDIKNIHMEVFIIKNFLKYGTISKKEERL